MIKWMVRAGSSWCCATGLRADTRSVWPRFLFILSASFALLPAAFGQGIVADVTVNVEVPTDVPRSVGFVPSQWSVTQTQSQVFRIALSNTNPSVATAPIDVALVRMLAAGLDQLDLAVIGGCTAQVVDAPDRRVVWNVGVLPPFGSVVCDIRFRARPEAVPGFSGFRVATRVGQAEGGTIAFFLQSPTDLVNADLALTVTNPRGLANPGTIQRIAFDVRNFGPDAHSSFSVAIGSYAYAFTDQTPTPDPFRIIGVTDPACGFNVTTLGAGDPMIAFTNVSLPTIPPGESRRCEVLVEILPSARGRSRSLPVILTHFGVGVVEADRLNNIGALQFTFTAEPVPTGSDRWLLPLAVLVLLAGLGFIRAQRRVA
jgi:hypothetical protein